LLKEKFDFIVLADNFLALWRNSPKEAIAKLQLDK